MPDHSLLDPLAHGTRAAEFTSDADFLSKRWSTPSARRSCGPGHPTTCRSGRRARTHSTPPPGWLATRSAGRCSRAWAPAPTGSLGATYGLVFSEQTTTILAEALGKAAAFALAERASLEAATRKRPLQSVLRRYRGSAPLDDEGTPAV